jgi:DNA-binding MarR family transcriptional regulator
MRLFHEDGINQKNLSNYLQMDKATTTRAIKKLVDEGYIFRQKDKEDKRSYRIFLSEKGKRLEPYMKNIASGWNDILLSSFDDNQKKRS